MMKQLGRWNSSDDETESIMIEMDGLVMKIQRTKNATRNIVYGVILKIFQIIIPFGMRTAMIYLLGIQYLGLNSLIASILQVLNLTELGVGSAMVYSMYKPITEDDGVTICALMRLYKIYYRVIGIIIAVIGMVLLPFIPHLISGKVPEGINIYILYLLNLGATVLSYWLFSYKNSLLQAHQRTDVISKITLATNAFQYIAQLAVLFLWKNYYYYLIVALLTQALTNVLTALIVTKMFPDYKPVGELDKERVREINRRVKDLFTSKLGAVIVNCTDSVVVSSFLGLTVLAVYNNYFFIMSSIIGFVTIIFSACSAGIGNSIIVETKEKNFSDLKKFTFLISWIAGFCTCCFLCLYQPFMKIWVGEKYCLSFRVVICFCIYYFVYEINQLLNLYKDSAGIWHKDKYRPLASALTNLALNLILVQYIGIYGVLLSTVISMLCVGMPWLLYNLFTIVFKRNAFHYIIQLFRYSIITALVCIATYGCCRLIPGDSVIIFLIKIVICCIIPNVLFLVIYYRREEFRQLSVMVSRMAKSWISVIQKPRRKLVKE